jgi:hypothetical protein
VPSALTCTLAQAINAANTANGVMPTAYGSSTPDGDCPGGVAGSNTIVINVPTVTLTTIDNYWYGPNALPPIASTILILGDGQVTTIRAVHTGDPKPATANAFRLFYVSGGMELHAGALTIVDLVLQGGYAKGGDSGQGGGGAGMGGAIFNQGYLSLKYVSLIGNTAQGGATNLLLDRNGGGGMGQDGGLVNGGGFGGTLALTTAAGVRLQWRSAPGGDGG